MIERGIGMRVCIFTLGSRGDVQPYVALAKCLIRMGHSAKICTGESFQSFVESHGVQFHRTTSDLMAVARTPEGKAIIEAPMKHILLAMRYAKNVLNPAYRKTLDDFFNGAQGTDLIIYHPKALGAVDIAISLGIPCVSMPPVPITYPITEFPNIAVAPAAQWGKVFNKLSYQINVKAESSQIKEINDFRKKTLGLPPRKAGIYAFTVRGKEIPVVYPISPKLFPDVHSWSSHVFLPGFFFLEAECNSLEPELVNFLAHGSAPVAVTFSSMPLKNPIVFVQKLEKALRETSNRAVILTGNSGITMKSSEQICVVKEAPHDLLFARAKGAIHHGGVGTMAAALQAGIPQLIIPFSVDQPFWAKRLYDLGYSLKPLRENTLSAEDLENALLQMDHRDIRETSWNLASHIRMENGTEATVHYLESLC